MITDQNKGITNISYNHLNLPTQVTLGGQNINYVYDASGVKLRKTVQGVTTDYAGNYIYENNTLQFFNHPEGYVKKDGSAFNYVYQYKDHLGNIRLSYADTDNNGSINTITEIIEESNYYPFGLKHKGYNNVTSSNGNSVAQKWKYNGIEYEESLGLDLYEMDVRMYNPALGRFQGIDPVTHHSFGTSVAFDNNPIFWADPTGADAYSVTASAGADWSGMNLGPSREDAENQSENRKCVVGVDCPSDFDDQGEGTVVLDEIVLNTKTKKFSKGIPYNTSGLNFAKLEKMFTEINNGNIRSSDYTLLNKWSESNNIIDEITYDIFNQPWITIQLFNPFDNQIQNIDGTASFGGQLRDDSILGFVSIATFRIGQFASGLRHLKSSPDFYIQFSKKTKGMFKGINHNKLRSNAYKEMINLNNTTFRYFKDFNKDFSFMTRGIDVLSTKKK